MWSRWWCAGGGGSLLRQRASFVFSGSHGCVGKLHPFDPLSGFGGECGGRRGGVAFVLKQMKRGVCSTTSVSCLAGDSCGNGSANNNNNNSNKSNGDNGDGTKGSPTSREAKKLMRWTSVESFKEKLVMEGKEIIPYSQFLEKCEKMGVASNAEEAAAFTQSLDDTSHILLFRNKVFLHPDKVLDPVKRAVPVSLIGDDDEVKKEEELKKLGEKKREIDELARMQVRKIQWCGLGFFVFTFGLFFRLTFWEFSWDVMEPITYFTAASFFVIGYGYSMFTSRDPTYQDLIKRLFYTRQKILCKNYNFDAVRFKELQCMCQKPFNAKAISSNGRGGEHDLEDVLRKD
ncbi:hypothetical protein PHAVU_008G243500 [Phaseolus vulgaris]|uniref:Calcium uniporter protein C-terminal domain-containing protein n=1 Tax=Phaseolus vulgaris TaxID=3885 RepID=V7B7X0_PHAVU|nr:hypothetical protein PHAVU_008G243500g [Phaseolus vulgaris]ESW13987.1 hypothetical protein PHAVU_008G243500g [Phaseolus vulgaris]